MTKRQWRDLCVRVIEDAVILLWMVIGIWLVCTIVGGLFRIMGVS